MLKELTRIIESNPLGDWLIALGVAAGLFLLLTVVHRVLLARLAALARRTTNKLDDLFVEVLRKTKYLILLGVSVYGGAQMLALGPAATRLLDGFLAVIAILQAGWWGSAVIGYWVATEQAKREAADRGKSAGLSVLGMVARIALWSIVLLLTLDNIGVNVTGLVAGLGIGGIAIALAIQSILGDLFASLSIVLDQPFELGDFVVVDEHLGSVEHIGWKTTRIRSLSGEQIVFSNTDLLKSRIRNFKRMAERRVVFSVGVTYDTPTEKVQAIPDMLKGAVTAQSDTRFDRAHFKEFGDSAFLYECVYYVLVPDYNRFMDIQQAINFQILRQFRDEGIEFAFPTRTVVLQGDNLPGAVQGAAGKALSSQNKG
jgi:small-conductance mechanosensitive channel